MKTLIALLLISQFACQSKHSEIEQIEFSSSACFGTCPVFSIKINKDRNAVFNAEEYNDTTGLFSCVIKNADYDSLIYLINNANILSLKDHYSVDYTDMPSSSLTVRFVNGKTKTIEDYGKTGTKDLVRIYDFIFKLRNTQNWK